MNKLIKGALVGGALLLAFPAFAATVSSQAVFPNGQTQVYGNGGQSVQTSFQVHVNAGEVLHAIRTKVDGLPTACTAVGPFEGDQTVTVNTNITLPPNSSAGGYSLVADLFTTDTLPQAQAMTGDLACSSAGAGAHVFSNAYSGPTVVNVLPASGGSVGGSNLSIAEQIANAFKSMKDYIDDKLKAAPVTPAPTVSAACTAYAQANAGTMMNVKNDANVRLQGFLLSQGAVIPALAAGASFGFYGPQTQSAVSWFQNGNHCN